MPDGAAVRHRAGPPPADVALACAVAVVSLAEVLLRPSLDRSPLALLAVVVLAVPLVARRSHPLAASATTAVLRLAGGQVADGYPPNVEFVLIPLLAYSCGAHLPRRRGLLGAAVLVCAEQIGVGLEEFPNVELLVAAAPAWWAGTEVLRRRELVRELEARTLELEAEEEAFARLSVRRERARIARELHDIVSHHLAVMVIQAGAGRLASAAHADAAPGRFATIRDAGLQALDEMARLVDLLRADGGHDLRLAALLAHAAEAGVTVEVTGLPQDVGLPPGVEATAYRVIQEGLTNAMKHAPGAAVCVRVALEGDALELEVADGGMPRASPIAATGSGLGLTGMRERVALLGGVLDAGPDGSGGWRLRARLTVAGHRSVLGSASVR